MVFYGVYIHKITGYYHFEPILNICTSLLLQNGCSSSYYNYHTFKLFNTMIGTINLHARLEKNYYYI